jgi:PKD repeat protein
MAIAVAIAGGTVFTQVDLQSCNLETRNFESAFPSVTDVAQFENETVLMKVENPSDSSIELKEIAIQEEGEEVDVVDVNKGIGPESSTVVNTTRFATAETCEKRKINLKYSSDKLDNLSAKGLLSGKLSLVPIKAVIEAKPVLDVEVGENVSFNASKSSAKNDIIHYNWSFGDGETASGNLTEYNFTTSGLYNVELEIEDDKGLTDTETIQIFVGGILQSGGGNISALRIGESVATGCIGPKCETASSSSEKPITTDKAEMEGTLFVENLTMLDGELCITSKKALGSDQSCDGDPVGEENLVSKERDYINGTLETPSIKPENNQLCIGNTTKCQ